MEYKRKLSSYNLKKYLAIGFESASASMIIAGIATKNNDLIAIGSSMGFPFLFCAYDVLQDRRKIKKSLESKIPENLINKI